MEPQALADRVRGAVRRLLGTEALEVSRIDAGLGLRSFFRIRIDASTVEAPETMIARLDAEEDPAVRPAALAPEPSLEPLRTFLAERGVPLPRSYGSDATTGVVLLEDLGSTSLELFATTATSDERRAIYAEACRIIPRIQRAEDPAGRVPAFGRRLDERLFEYKAELFARVSLPTGLGRAPRRPETDVVREAFAWIARESATVPARLAHRDFQSSNLLVRCGAPPGERLGVIAFQGALLAPPEYDLVCLLRDSYVELSDADVASLVSATREDLPDTSDPESFARRFDLLTLTRKGKDHARFLSAAQERRDDRYLRHLPATVRYLRAAAARAARREPRLAALAELIQALPEEACAR
jgi:aminoglycoside/choline kinase family phosphotransferase